MPLLKKINNNNYQIGIWKVDESELDPFKSSKLSPNYHPKFLDFKNEFRKWQINAVKLLYNELDPNNEMISINGIPYAKNGGYISISHTKDIVAMITANYKCGIDIEKRDRNTLKIKHKFLHPNDFILKEIKEDSLRIWCMKEVLFKIKKDSSIKFKDHLIISRQKDDFLGNCLHPRFSFKCSIKVFNFENYFLAFNTSYRELNKND